MSDTEPKLQPCLAELLRTCMKPESMILQVDGIVAQETTIDLGNRSAPPQTITRFQLTDGELRIQALLPPVLLAHHDLKVGDRIAVRDFVVRKARRLNGSGKVIYLHIRDFALPDQHSTNTKTKAWDGEEGFVKSDAEEEDIVEPSPKRRKRNMNRVAFAGLPNPASDDNDSQRGDQQPEADRQAPSQTRNGSMTTNDDAGSEDEFESVTIDLPQVQQRRQTLRTIRQAGAPTATPSDGSEQPETPPRHTTAAPEQPHDPTTQLSHEAPPTATAEQRNSSPSSPFPPSPPVSSLPPPIRHNPQPLTLPYHPLSSLLSQTLPSRNYPLTTLAIITHVSSTLILPTKPNSPFPAKRNIRILDPSLSQHPSQHSSHHPQGFSLAIYVDAKSFLPQPGTIALFRGIVMQKFNREIILNAYATLKDKPANEKWYIHDEQVLQDMGFDVKGMRRWWEERVSRNVRKSSGSLNEYETK